MAVIRMKKERGGQTLVSATPTTAVAIQRARLSRDAVRNRRHSTGGNCIAVTIPDSIGGQEVYQSGAAARSTCRAVDQPGGFDGRAGNAVAAQCRKVGFPVGSAG